MTNKRVRETKTQSEYVELCDNINNVNKGVKMDLKQKLVISGLTVASFMLTGVAAKATVFQMASADSGKIVIHEDEAKCGKDKKDKDAKCGKDCKDGKLPDGKDCDGSCGEGTCGKDMKKE